MFSGFKAARPSACALALAIISSCTCAAGDLRVCADPDNLPFSNSRGQGFENQLARLAAHSTGRGLKYVWMQQRGKFFEAVEEGKCDAVMGVPAAMNGVETTRPYYRSSYVFVYRRGRGVHVTSFDDPQLRGARIGVHVMGEDDGTAPPTQALLDRGLAGNIEWYKLYPDFSRPNAPSALIEAVARGAVDIAVAWGPMAGYFAARSSVPLEVAPVSPQLERGVPLAFDIAMGVRRGDAKLAAELNRMLARHASEIHALLERYRIPLVPVGETTWKTAHL